MHDKDAATRRGLSGESRAQTLARIGKEAIRWAREAEEHPRFCKIGDDVIRLKRRGGGHQIVPVEVLAEADRRGRPIPDRVWHRFPDGALVKRYADDATQKPTTEGATFRLPSAMQARNAAMSESERARRREKVEPISTDPGDFTARYVFAPLP